MSQNTIVIFTRLYLRGYFASQNIIQSNGVDILRLPEFLAQIRVTFKAKEGSVRPAMKILVSFATEEFEVDGKHDCIQNHNELQFSNPM